jgi:SAM-dependent methyltransferase
MLAAATPAWTQGYRTDQEYTFGIYPFLNPDGLQLICALRGIAPPKPILSGGAKDERGLVYCELGCGQGVTLNLMAARDPGGQYYGIDYNPTQIANARNFAQTARLTNVTFLEESFADLADTSLPECDIIVLHGIWTWIDDALQDKIIAFMRRKLKPGGLCFVSYNSAVGRNDGPMRQLLLVTERMATGTGMARVSEAIALAREAATNGAKYFQDHPVAKSRLDSLSDYAPSYVIHEFLNQVWKPRYFHEVVASMAEAKLSYVGSSDPTWNRNDLILPAEATTLVQRATTIEDVEFIKDMWTGNMFRKDIYVKGSKRLNTAEQEALLAPLRFALVKRPDALSYTIPIPVGVGTLDAKMFETIFEKLKKGPVTGAELSVIGSANNSTGCNIAELLLVSGFAVLCVDAKAVDRIAKSMAGFDDAVTDMINRGNEMFVMTLPALGTAIMATPIDYFIWRATRAKIKNRAADCFGKLKNIGKSVVQHGEVITDEAKALELLNLMTNHYDENLAPIVNLK